MTIDKIIDGIIQREGEYSNDPSDHGGPTRWGITEAVARAHGYAGDMRALPQQLARGIYRQSYYVGPGFDQVATISPRIAEELTDTGVNMGPPQAAEFLQRALNVLNKGGSIYPDLAVDGHLGPQSITALAAYFKARGAEGEGVLLLALNCLQGARYIALAESRPANEDFEYGWLKGRVAL